MYILKIILSIFLPPVAAYLQVGISTHFWVNIVLTLLGGIPGVIHALWLVLTKKTAQVLLRNPVSLKTQGGSLIPVLDFTGKQGVWSFCRVRWIVPSIQTIIEIEIKLCYKYRG